MRGDILDIALVDKKQLLVEQFMNEYFEQNPDLDRTTIEGVLSEQFNPDSVKFITNNANVKQVIVNDFQSKGIKFDIGNIEHRKLLGYGLVDIINEERRH